VLDEGLKEKKKKVRLEELSYLNDYIETMIQDLKNKTFIDLFIEENY